MINHSFISCIISIFLILPFYGNCQTASAGFSEIDPFHAIGSAVFGGVNVGTAIINVANMDNPDANDLGPTLGIISGGASIFLGIDRYVSVQNNNVIDGRKTLCMFNVGFGTISLICAFSHLSIVKPEKPKTVTLNITGLPSVNNQVGMGLSLKKRF